MVVNGYGGYGDQADEDRRELTTTLTGWRRFVDAAPARLRVAAR